MHKKPEIKIYLQEINNWNNSLRVLSKTAKILELHLNNSHKMKPQNVP